MTAAAQVSRIAASFSSAWRGLMRSAGVVALAGCFYNPSGSVQTSEVSTTASATTGTSLSGEVTSGEPTSSATTSTATTSSEPTSTATTTSTSDATSTTDGPGHRPEMCDPRHPGDPACGELYCVAFDTCNGCTAFTGDTTCSDVDAATPVCDPESGKCVECTAEDASACASETPVCDPESRTCAGCSEHSQCPNTACDIETGACFPDEPGAIVFVENKPGSCGVAPAGTEDDPFCSLAEAAEVLQESQPTTIKVKPGMPQMTPLALPIGDYVVAVRAADEQVPELEGSANTGPMIDVNSENRVYLWRLWIHRSGGDSLIRCAPQLPGLPGTLHVHDVRLFGDGSAATGLQTDDCAVRLTRSRVWQCSGGGIEATGGSLRIESSSLVANGSPASAFGALSLAAPEEVVIRYSSFVDHPATSTSSTFHCGGPAPSGGVQLRNSLVLNLEPLESLDCLGWIEATNSSVVEASSGNELAIHKDAALGPLEDAVYPPKVDGDLAGVAMWGEGDPRLDVDLTPIPVEAPSYAGCDQPQP